MNCILSQLRENGRLVAGVWQEGSQGTDRQNRQTDSCPWSSEVFQFVVHWCSLVPKDPCVPRTRVVVHTSLWFNQLCLLHSLSQLFQLKVSQFCLSLKDQLFISFIFSTIVYSLSILWSLLFWNWPVLAFLGLWNTQLGCYLKSYYFSEAFIAINFTLAIDFLNSITFGMLILSS